MSHRVEVLEEVRLHDVPELLSIEPGIGRVLAGIVRDLHFDPWLGREMRERLRLEVLRDCRKIPFDVPSHAGKPRFRLVYRNDPSDGSIPVVCVLAVGPCSNLDAYRRAATRLGARERRGR